MFDALFGEMDVSDMMLPGDSHTLYGKLPVGEDEANIKLLESPVTATVQGPGTAAPLAPVSDYVETKVISHPSMTFEKSVDMGDTEVFCVGDEIIWKAVIVNTGDITLRNLSVHDELLESIETPFTVEEGAALAPGQKMEIEVPYTLTQDDIDSGHVSNTAYATATSTDGTEVTTGESTAESDIERFSTAKVTKTVDKRYIADAAAGEVLEYTVTVENTGNTTLSDVEIVDELNGAEQREIKWASNEGILLPGESVEATFTYAVTNEDIASGKLANVAHAEYRIPAEKQERDNDEIEMEPARSDDAVAETQLVAPEDTDPLDRLVASIIKDDIVPAGLVSPTGDLRLGSRVALGVLAFAAVAGITVLVSRRRKR